ncbi:MAG: hypothetical protein ACTHU0_36385 [Kofleriaceae bacterium]
MERFPRGTLPPTAHSSRTSSAPERRAPSQVEPPRQVESSRKVEPPPSTLKQPAVAAASPRESCDLASTCPNCNIMMQPEHAHYRCLSCGYRDSCCF